MMQKDAAKQANCSVGSDLVPLHCLGLFGGAPPLQDVWILVAYI